MEDLSTAQMGQFQKTNALILVPIGFENMGNSEIGMSSDLLIDPATPSWIDNRGSPL